MRYEQNIDTPTQDLVVNSLIELGPNVTSISVRNLIFQQPPLPVQGFLFESNSLKISAKEIAAEGIIRWKYANSSLAAKPPSPPTPGKQPAGAAGSDDPDSDRRRDGSHGAPGLPASPGAHGKAGQPGPDVIVLCDKLVGYLAIDVRGSRGQDGQDGGQGGQGGDGGPGGKADSGDFECHKRGAHGGNAGRGGDGGPAGDGGKGGKGGTVRILFTTSSSADVDPIIDGGEGGAPGIAGAGGPPGNPGRGGHGDPPRCGDEHESHKGSPNTSGSVGNPGRFLGRGDDGSFAINQVSNQELESTKKMGTQQFTSDVRSQPGKKTFKRRVHISLKALGWIVFSVASLHAADTASNSNRQNASAKPNPEPTIENIIGYGSTIYKKDLLAPSRYIASSSRVKVAGMPVVLGQGYDSLSGQFRGIGVLRGSTVANDPALPDGQSIEYHFDYLKNSTELRRTLNINASGSLNIGLFSADAHVNIFKEHTENASSSYLVIRARVVNQVKRLDTLNMSSASLFLLKKPEAFVRTYGDQFITGIISGGELIGIVELQFRSVSDKQSFNAKLDASYGTFGSLSVSIEQAVKASVKNLRVNASLLRVGGSTQPRLIEYDGSFDIIWKKIDKNMTDLAQTFIEDVKAHPVIIEVTTSDYNVCDNINRTGYNAPTLSFAKWYYDLFAAAVEKQRALVQGDTSNGAQTVAERLPAKARQALRFMASPVIFDASAEHLYSYVNKKDEKAAQTIETADKMRTDIQKYRDFISSTDPLQLMSVMEAETKSLPNGAKDNY